MALFRVRGVMHTYTPTGFSCSIMLEVPNVGKAQRRLQMLKTSFSFLTLHKAQGEKKDQCINLSQRL